MTEFGIPEEKQYRRLLEGRLPAKTLRHVASVAETIVSFHEKAGITLVQAVTAGLLHDVCKAMKPKPLQNLAHEYGITEYLDSPNLPPWTRRR